MNDYKRLPGDEAAVEEYELGVQGHYQDDEDFVDMRDKAALPSYAESQARPVSRARRLHRRLAAIAGTALLVVLAAPLVAQTSAGQRAASLLGCGHSQSATGRHHGGINYWSGDQLNLNAGFGGEFGHGSPAYTCPKQPGEPSCHNSTAMDTCCFNAPGGQLLLAQFWNAAPAIGPEDMWTLHGLWPDHCDGSFDQFCDSSREVENAEAVLVSMHRYDLVREMHRIWKDRTVDNNLWVHEWNKHGTCMSTMRPQCYGDNPKANEIALIEYYAKAIQVFYSLPTYHVLAERGIVPSYTKKYRRDDVAEAFRNFTGGHDVTLGCHQGEFTEVWYHFNVMGSAQHGKYLFADADGDKSTCPEYISYRPKTPNPNPLPPFHGRGYISSPTQQGCLISTGQWYAHGTCATYHTDISGHNLGPNQVRLRSSKGPCALDVTNKLVCSHTVQPAIFDITANGTLAYAGKNRWAISDAAKWGKADVVLADDGAELTWINY
ncbi:ribonuclease T2-like protein [Dipodascopsis tothii]|uniref:ribonuclease T2-like protein n=1 Tax=Dipodascopsis tothii TaxID=44089 RepID=UPI0034CEB778